MLVNAIAEGGKKAQLFEAALGLMRKNGYQGTSMRDIAAALNMEAASLYNHIDSKEEILHQTCFSLASAFIRAMDEINDIYFNGEEKLKMAVRNHIHILTEHLDASYVFIHEWRNLSEPQKSEFIALRDEYEQKFRVILKNGEDDGAFNEVNNKFAVLTILSSLNWVVEWYNPKGEMTAEQIADKLTDFILSGLKKDKL